jgi:hypothetical protein
MRTVRNGLQFLWDLEMSLPNKNDSAFTIVAKMAGLGTTVADALATRGAIDAEAYRKSMGIRMAVNQIVQFVVVDGPWRSRFESTTVKISEGSSVHMLRNPKYGTLYVFDDGSCHEAGAPIQLGFKEPFNTEALVEDVWSHFNGKITLAIRSEPVFMACKGTKDPLLGSSVARLERFVAKHDLYLQDKVPRTYLFRGPPGCGKSTFALRVAEGFRGRTIVLTPESVRRFADGGHRWLSFLLQLDPDITIFDDIDRLDSSSTLELMQAVEKLRDLGRAVAFTVNSLDRLPEPLLRPGRIDEIIDFDPPSAEDRELILRGYLDSFGVTKAVDMARIVKITKGMTGAYLREIALQLKYITEDDLDEVLRRLNVARSQPSSLSLNLDVDDDEFEGGPSFEVANV